MDTSTNIIDSAVAEVLQSPSSIFSKDDVIKLLDKLYSNLAISIHENPTITEATQLQFQEFNSNVKSRLYQYFNNNDLVDYDSAEFEIDYNNKIVLNNVCVDLDSWADEFDNIMLDEYQSTFW